MHVFSRLTSFILFILSLSLFAHALPAPGASGALVARDPKCDQLVDVVVDLKAKVDTCISAIVKAEVLADVSVQIDAIVAHVNTCAEAVVAIGAVADIDAVVKADIAARVAAIIAASFLQQAEDRVIVKACLRLSVKFGLQVFLELFVKIDAALKLLLVNLGVCIDGIVVLISDIVITTCAHILVTLDFKLCLSVLALVGIY